MILTLQKKIKSIFKIGIIIFVSISFFADFRPFYDGFDDHAFALMGINFAKGSYGYTNELYTETGSYDFRPLHWIDTEQDYLVPLGSPGVVITSALFYLIGGYYGLFYLGPIFSILFLIISERVATKLFGGFVGLIALVLLASDVTFFNVGVQLLTDNIFAVFFILGVFFLIKFLRSKKDKFILISSIIFVISAFIRFNGLIFLPIEVSLVVGYFIFQNISASRRELTSNKFLSKITLSKINGKRILKISALMILPWLSVFLFYFSYNDYYFGDPLTNYYSRRLDTSELFTSFFTFDTDRYDSIKSYSIVFLPDILGKQILISGHNDIIRLPISNVDNILGNFLSIFSFFIFVFALTVSLYIKNKRIEVLVFLPFIFIGFLFFYSSDYAFTIGHFDRFMIPALPLSFILLGFILDSIWKINPGRFSRKNPSIISKSFKVGFLIFVGIFLFSSLTDAQSVQKILKNDFNFNNPEAFASIYPLDHEGLTEESIIVETRGRRAMEYGAIPFLPVHTGKINFMNELDPSWLPQKPILNLKKLLSEDHEAYTFKSHKIHFEPLYFRYLESVHGIILKDYSKTFCKMEIIENLSEQSGTDIISDDVCYMYRGKIVPKN